MTFDQMSRSMASMFNNMLDHHSSLMHKILKYSKKHRHENSSLNSSSIDGS